MIKPWQNIPAQALEALENIYTLLNFEEQQMLYYFGAQTIGKGAIVDLGCHLGGSSARLALGASSRHKNPKLHIYDRFEVKYPLEKLLDRVPQYLHEIATCENTLPLVTAMLQKNPANFIIHKGEFMELNWSKEPVELLFVDIGKNLRTLDHVTKQFYPHLIPNISIIIHQDYQYIWNPWIAVHCELWADKFQYIDHTESESVIFRLSTSISHEEIKARQMTNLSDSELWGLFEQARQRFAHTSIRLRLDQMYEKIKNAPFPRRTIGKKFISLKEKRYTANEAEQLRKAQTTSGISARRRAKREASQN